MKSKHHIEDHFGYEAELAPPLKAIPDDSVMTPNDVSDMIGLSVRQVRRYCESGKIRSYCFGSKYVIYGSDFKEFMKQYQVRPKTLKEMVQ
jgi:excisionase family DNA binding protein